MPVTQKTYPEWVQKYRTRGKTVKKKGDAYYLYSRTSKRVPGKKYPQPVDTYIGIITPDGIIETNKKKVALTDIEVWEYGFSKAITSLCPKGWKEPLGKDWEDILKILICDWSHNSYLKMEEMMWVSKVHQKALCYENKICSQELNLDNKCFQQS